MFGGTLHKRGSGSPSEPYSWFTNQNNQPENTSTRNVDRKTLIFAIHNDRLEAFGLFLTELQTGS